MVRPYNHIEYSLSEALNLLRAEKKNFKDVIFTGVTHKDSDVLPGDIFLAFPGATHHGAEFIKSAQAGGAVAVLTDEIGAQYSTD